MGMFGKEFTDVYNMLVFPLQFTLICIFGSQ